MRAGFVGLGQVGFGMALNIVKKGFELTSLDVRQEPMDQLAAEGAAKATSAYEVGQRSDIVFICVLEEQQVRDVVLGNGDDKGALAGMDGGYIVICSTISPGVVRSIAETAVARNVKLLDAPLTGGGAAAAMAGTLTLFVGGAAEDVAAARPVLETMASNIFHVGPLGGGSTVKIISNFLAVSHMLIVREALRLGRAAEIREETLLEMINTGKVGSNWATQNWAWIQEHEPIHPAGPTGMARINVKDLKLAHTMANEYGAVTPALHYLNDHVVGDVMINGLTDRGIDFSALAEA